MNIILALHNILRWAILLFGLWALLNALTGVFTKRNYTATDNRINLFFMISCDMQLLIGLILYFGNSWFNLLKNNAGEVMKNSAERFFTVEHSLMMIIAWLLVHVGRSMVKRIDIDAQKHKRSLIYFGIAIALILLMIPWSFKPAGIARGLMPHF